MLWPNPGWRDRPGPSGSTEPGPPARARPDWRSLPASSLLTCPSQPIGATRIGAVMEEGEDAVGRWPSCPPRGVPSRPAAIPSLVPAAGCAPRTPLRSAWCPARFNAAASGRARSASPLDRTHSDGVPSRLRSQSHCFPPPSCPCWPGRGQPH